MKKFFTLFLMFFAFLSVNAQKKEKVKDTVKTEVVNIITKYNPKIADAKKIKKSPKINLLKKSERKKLEYAIFSAPVASTFIPKSGVVKGIDVGVKERVYKNYLALGFGNYRTSYVDAFLHHQTRFNNEFGFNAKYLVSQENVKNSFVDSDFLNFNTGVFYKKQDRYFDWKIGLNSEKSTYKWYGLPNETYTEPILYSINEEQIYNSFKLIGDMDFKDSYIDYGKIKASYYTDTYNSTEILARFDAKLDFPLKFINNNFNDISIKTNAEFLKGEFKKSYKDLNPINYSITTFGVNPEYKMNFKSVKIKTGVKLIASLDSENNLNNVFALPDLFIESPIIKGTIDVYAGVSGNLYTNTYKGFSEENPFVSPTLFITQTLEKSNFFIGFNGKMTRDVSYNIKANYKEEEDKPLFLRNASKFNGVNTNIEGYEFGNSFNVIYDDVKTTTIFGEIEYNVSKNLSFSTQGIYNIYTTKNALEAWNLPAFEASLRTKYKNRKWFAITNIFYVSERKDALYNSQFPSSISAIEKIDSFIDVNLNGGYHINDKFSAFLKLNNILNSNYDRFANFNTQGFQVLAGITYKFDFLGF